MRDLIGAAPHWATQRLPRMPYRLGLTRASGCQNGERSLAFDNTLARNLDHFVRSDHGPKLQTAREREANLLGVVGGKQERVTLQPLQSGECCKAIGRCSQAKADPPVAERVKFLQFRRCQAGEFLPRHGARRSDDGVPVEDLGFLDGRAEHCWQITLNRGRRDRLKFGGLQARHWQRDRRQSTPRVAKPLPRSRSTRGRVSRPTGSAR